MSEPEKIHFAVVVDGDVAFTVTYPTKAQNAVAAMQSNPQIVEIPEDLVGMVTTLWNYDGLNWTPPTSE